MGRIDIRLDNEDRDYISSYCKKNKISMTKLILVAIFHVMNENEKITKEEINELIEYYRGELKYNE